MKKRVIRFLFSIILTITIFMTVTYDTYAYYCSDYCRTDACAIINPDAAGLCSHEMECVDSCTGHHAVPCYIVMTEATCTQNGLVQTQICDAVSSLGICHKRDKFENIPALGHNYGPWIEVSGSEHRRICNRCNGAENNGIQYAPHNYTTNEVLKYEDKGDTHTTTFRHVCIDCGHQEVWSESNTHQYGAWIINSYDKCTATRTCICCGHSESEWIGVITS